MQKLCASRWCSGFCTRRHRCLASARALWPPPSPACLQPPASRNQHWLHLSRSLCEGKICNVLHSYLLALSTSAKAKALLIAMTCHQWYSLHFLPRLLSAFFPLQLHDHIWNNLLISNASSAVGVCKVLGMVAASSSL